MKITVEIDSNDRERLRASEWTIGGLIRALLDTAPIPERRLHHRDCDVYQATLASEGPYGDPTIDPEEYQCVCDWEVSWTW